MEEKATAIETLVEKAETYAKTNIDLLKLKSVDKLSDITSTIVVKIAFVLIVSLITIMVSFGLAFWIGDLLGQTYFGFFAVAVLYLIIALVIYSGRNSWIRVPIKNAVINDFLDEKDTEA